MANLMALFWRTSFRLNVMLLRHFPPTCVTKWHKVVSSLKPQQKLCGKCIANKSVVVYQKRKITILRVILLMVQKSGQPVDMFIPLFRRFIYPNGGWEWDFWSINSYGIHDIPGGRLSLLSIRNTIFWGLHHAAMQGHPAVCQAHPSRIKH